MSLTDTNRNSEVSGEASLSLNVQEVGANENRCRLRACPQAVIPPLLLPVDSQQIKSQGVYFFLTIPNQLNHLKPWQQILVVLWCAGAFELITNYQKAVHSLATETTTTTIYLLGIFL